jgi:hypothetical protein
MTSWEKDISRLYIKNKNSTKVLKFLNIVTVKKTGEFIEYKVTLEGFPKTPLRIGKGVLNVFEGIKHLKKPGLLLKGDIEISYHKDGTTNYKDRGQIPSLANIKPKKHFPSINKLRKPKLLIRITGFRLSLLQKALQKDKGKENEIVHLNPTLADKYLCCDIRISGKPYLRMDYKNSADNQETFSFVNEDKNIGLQLHFYEVSNTRLWIVIPDPSIWGWMKQRYYYLKYELLKLSKK